MEEEIVSRDNNGDEATKNNQQVIKGEMFEPEFSKICNSYTEGEYVANGNENG